MLLACGASVTVGWLFFVFWLPAVGLVDCCFLWLFCAMVWCKFLSVYVNSVDLYDSC